MNEVVLQPQVAGGKVEFQDLIREALRGEAELEEKECEPCGKNQRHILRGNLEFPAEQRALVIVIALFRQQRTGK